MIKEFLQHKDKKGKCHRTNGTFGLAYTQSTLRKTKRA